MSKIKQLIESSKQVILDCSLPNGAIVAANSSKSYFPKEAKYYKFVWPRDAAYTCIAANILGINIQEKFFKWCMKAQDWEKAGLFYEKYFPNGKKALHHLQPDQTASVLIALHDYCKDKEKRKKFEKLIKKSADGLCRIWEKDHFKLINQDLWEEKLCFPDLKENFTYSLAMCYRGLSCANELITNREWSNTANQMKEVLLASPKEHFFRSFGELNDERIDASLLGLVWPADIVKADNKIMQKTVEVIEDRIVKNYRVYRYENDEYDGWMCKNLSDEEKRSEKFEVLQKGFHRNKGSGYWPVLNFWMTMYYLKRKNKIKALEYYEKVLKDLRSNFIPEQIFDNSLQVSVSPLCWSHSMFIIASKELGYIK